MTEDEFRNRYYNTYRFLLLSVRKYSKIKEISPEDIQRLVESINDANIAENSNFRNAMTDALRGWAVSKFPMPGDRSPDAVMADLWSFHKKHAMQMETNEKYKSATAEAMAINERYDNNISIRRFLQIVMNEIETPSVMPMPDFHQTASEGGA